MPLFCISRTQTLEIEKIIDHRLFALKLTDKVDFAIESFEDLSVLALPVVQNDILKGFVDKESFKNVSSKKTIESFVKPNLGWVLTENFPYMEAIKRFAEYEAECLAIINKSDEFLGIISKTSILIFLSKSYSIQAEGSVITIEMLARNYSLNELTRIIENEGTKILGVKLFSLQDTARIQVSIKLNTGYNERVIQSLQRFGFDVTNSYYTNHDESDVELRYNSLLKYLEL